MNIVQKELIMHEIEEKSQARQLREFKRQLENKASPKPEDLPRIKQIKTEEEVLQTISEMRKRRFQEDKRAIKLLLLSKRPPPRKIVEKKETDEVFIGVMYPVDPELLAVLYDGVSANSEGRWLYLQKRKKAGPYDKYIFSQSFGMDYGWNVEQRAFPTHKQHARHGIIQRSFYTRGGVKEGTQRNRKPLTTGIVTTDLL